MPPWSSAGNISVKPTPNTPHPQAHAHTTLGVITIAKTKNKVRIFGIIGAADFTNVCTCLHTSIGSYSFNCC